MGNRSFSQYSTYVRCSEAYRLEKLAKVPEIPSVWMDAGTHMHSALDRYDLEGVTDTKALAVEVAEKLEASLMETVEETGVPLSEFRTTGVTKARPLGRDLAWWGENAELMIQQYIDWRIASGWTVATLGGKPAVEVPISLDLGHGAILRGYVDRVFIDEQGRPVVVDNKAGQRMPGEYQLATYAYSIGIEYGLDVVHGAFYMMAKDGLSSIKYLAGYMANHAPQKLYRRLDHAIDSGVFVPNIGSNCFGCGVRAHCQFTGR